MFDLEKRYKQLKGMIIKLRVHEMGKCSYINLNDSNECSDLISNQKELIGTIESLESEVNDFIQAIQQLKEKEEQELHTFECNTDEPIYNADTVDSDIRVIHDSLSSLKEWTGFKQLRILYDSDVTQLACKELSKSVLNKEHLLFINFPEEPDCGDVFGGYVGRKIAKVGKWTKDTNTFVFSLRKKKEIVAKKHSWKEGKEVFAFGACSVKGSWMYSFGYNDDIGCYLGHDQSKCNNQSYKFDENELLTSNQNWTIRRVVVIQIFK